MEITLPNIQTLEKSRTYGKFVVEPLERGYGVTLGNSLRRVLLSSIPGAAITYVKIDKVLHEFDTIPGVKEDTTELLLNLKELHVKVYHDGSEGRKSEPRKLRIDVHGEGVVTGADVICPEDVEVVNPEVYLATLSDENAHLSMEMEVEIGKGYVLPDRQERRSQMGIGVIAVGAAFTPVRKVNYTVEATRVASDTSYERLILEIWTNGTIFPDAALREAARILNRYFNLFAEYEDGGLPLYYEEGPLSNPEAIPHVRIEELDFSVRTYNCLKKAGILTIADLVRYNEEELMQIRNFGRKSLDEVRERLAIYGLHLKGETALPPGTKRPSTVADAEDEEDDEDEEEEATAGAEAE
jgi:DNA-directed RNA polymerase subunit alpha